MATITGTTGTDTLLGTWGDDTLIGMGTDVAGEWDRLVGRGGDDTYDFSGVPAGNDRNFVISDSGGTDWIVHAGAMYHSASLGYSQWATAVRQGDNLVIHLPGKPYRFHDPAIPDTDIKIIGQFGGRQVESIEAGGVIYQLAASETGTELADIVAGSNAAETLAGLGGDDFLFGNGGRDSIDMGAGDDTGFGGGGRDTIMAGDGNDQVYGGDAGDAIHGEAGHDRIYGEAGNDRIWGEAGSDWLDGAEGNDQLRGGDGDDRLAGGIGDDLMIGGRGADIYAIAAYGGVDGAGQDTIRDQGDVGGWAVYDTIDISGIYGPSGGSVTETYAALRFERVGDDVIIHIDDGAGSQVTIENMLDSAHHNRFFIEKLEIDGAYWSPLEFRFLDGAVTDIGDDRSIFLTYGAKLNEILFGTDGDDQIFGGTGTNFIVTGDGADTLVYKVGDGASFGGLGGGQSHDIVEDFDVTQDRLDFTEVTNDLGAMPVLQMGTDADGDVTIYIDTGNWEVADILIELRGVTTDQITDDLFIF